MSTKLSHKVQRVDLRRITESYYEEKRKEYRAKQAEINGKISKLHFTDEEYYLTSEYLLKLASNASQLFESSEPHEKRLLLTLTLQNLKLDGNKVRYDWIKPFDQIANFASRQAWLRLVDAFCNHKIEFSVNLQLLQNFFTDWQLTPSFA